jgi:transcriptional regulator with XRE-family HTH domain
MKTNKEKTFGQLLIEARTAKDKSLSDMSHYVRISTTQLVKYERDQVQKPQDRTLRSICDAYGVKYTLAQSFFNQGEKAGQAASADIARDFQEIVHGQTGRGVWETQQAMRLIFEACSHDIDLMEKVAKTINRSERAKKKAVSNLVNGS